MRTFMSPSFSARPGNTDMAARVGNRLPALRAASEQTVKRDVMTWKLTSFQPLLFVSANRHKASADVASEHPGFEGK